MRAEKSTGNVFAHLGLPHPEQELLKAKLTLQIYRLIKRRDLTQAEARQNHRHQAGCAPSHVFLRNGRQTAAAPIFALQAVHQHIRSLTKLRIPFFAKVRHPC